MRQRSGWVVGVAVLAAGAGAACWGGGGTTPAAEQPPKKTDFGTGDQPPGGDVKFDAERCLKYLKQLCDIGPRVSGTEGMKRQQELVEKHFKDLGATVTRQEFKARQRSRPNETPMTNIVVSWHPDKDRRVILCAHYDTRPIADQEPNPGQWTKPFLSANDGTAGVALMMELGHHMKDFKPEVGVDFVLFDGEEYVFESKGDKYFFGSEHFAAEYTKGKAARKLRYEAGLLMDLCTAKGAVLRVEGYSFEHARGLVQQVWGVAKAVGAKSFEFTEGHTVLDDHIALNEAGIPTVDLIDFDYPHWHKLSDTPDKVSGEQAAEVARVFVAWVRRLK